jgi:hypothetical protein
VGVAEPEPGAIMTSGLPLPPAPPGAVFGPSAEPAFAPPGAALPLPALPLPALPLPAPAPALPASALPALALPLLAFAPLPSAPALPSVGPGRSPLAPA